MRFFPAWLALFAAPFLFWMLAVSVGRLLVLLETYWRLAPGVLIWGVASALIVVFINYLLAKAETEPM